MEDVEAAIKSFGGKVVGYVVNNLRAEPHEAVQVRRVQEKGLPVVTMAHDVRLGLPDPKLRQEALQEAGSLFDN